MELSGTEEALIDLLRGCAGVDFSMTVAWLGQTWTVSITTETDGHLTGQGDTFRQAFRQAFGFTDMPDGEPLAEPEQPVRLQVVAGTDRRPR